MVEKSEGFEVYIKEKPIEWRANKELIKVLSEYFKVEENKIRIIKGFKTRNKIVEIRS